jgi:hypothetical protein
MIVNHSPGSDCGQFGTYKGFTPCPSPVREQNHHVAPILRPHGLGKHLINFDQIFTVETLDILVSSVRCAMGVTGDTLGKYRLASIVSRKRPSAEAAR